MVWKFDISLMIFYVGPPCLTIKLPPPRPWVSLISCFLWKKHAIFLTLLAQPRCSTWNESLFTLFTPQSCIVISCCLLFREVILLINISVVASMLNNWLSRLSGWIVYFTKMPYFRLYYPTFSPCIFASMMLNQRYARSYIELSYFGLVLSWKWLIVNVGWLRQGWPLVVFCWRHIPKWWNSCPQIRSDKGHARA